MRGAWFVTPHAVERFRQRIAPDLSYERALEMLISDSVRAHRVKSKGDGVALYRGPRPHRFRYHVREDVESGAPQLLTVVPSFDSWRDRS